MLCKVTASDDPGEMYMASFDTCPACKTEWVFDLYGRTASCGCESGKTEGCIICEKELIYRTDTANERCMICGQSYETYVKCPEGHYVCDRCPSADILGNVERLLVNNSIEKPVELAEKVFELPGLNMHGPEYHSIVPAIIVTAYRNITGNRDITKIKEAIRRGKDTKGGSCGFNGNCGATVGTGIAVSILGNATPMSKVERGNANKATSFALLEISKHGGPRCCKREAITAIESFMHITSYFENVEKHEYQCVQYTKNKDCIGIKCPYFPKKYSKHQINCCLFTLLYSNIILVLVLLMKGGMTMFTLSLSEKEIDLLKKFINHCLETCKKGGAENGCKDCEALEGILKR
ncbi:MAG: DUF5714 domain-containing protein [Clostridia bacterium]